MSCERKTVLVVDDELILRRVGATFLARLGLTVMTAESGDSAIAMIVENGPPDLVVTDLNMEHGSGHDLLRYLRDSEGCGDLPVIVLSGTTSQPEIDLAHELGCSAFFSKPAHYPVVLDKVAQLLGLKVRKAKRYPINICGWLHVESHAFEVATMNISASGMLFETPCQLEVGDTYRACLDFPSSEPRDQREFQFRVVRSVASAEGRRRGYGVAFVFAGEEDRRQLKKLLQGLLDAEQG